MHCRAALGDLPQSGSDTALNLSQIQSNKMEGGLPVRYAQPIVCPGPANPWARSTGKGRRPQRGGAAMPPRSSCTTTPSRRGGGASHKGCARLVATSLSPACQRRNTEPGAKSATLPASPSVFHLMHRCRIVIVASLASARHFLTSVSPRSPGGTRSPKRAIIRRRSWLRRKARSRAPIG